MKVLIALAFVFALAAAQSGIAIIRGTTADSGVSGWVTFTINSGNSSLIDVWIQVTGITMNPDAQHGIHVHQWGDISDPAGEAAGSHFSLTGEVHSCPPNETRHTGDMGNWNATGGVINQTKTFDKLILTGPNSIIGRAVIVHSGVDDCVTQPTGNSGSRIGQGVIGIMNVTGNTASNGLARTNDSTVQAAMCFLVPIAGNVENITGYGLVTQGATGGVYIIVQLAGVNNGTVHAAHIHQYGDLRTAAAVGSHWNPVTQRHGMYLYPLHHAGDLGNIIYFQDAPNNTKPAANFTQWTNNSFNVVGGDHNILGLAMVIHQQRDDCSDPIGNSGSRFATCVWGLINPLYQTNLTVFSPPLPTGVSTAYDATTIANCNAQFNISSSSTSTSGSATSSSTGTGTGSTSTTTITTGSASFVAFSALTVLAAMLF